jgi:hypothetical protein
MTHHERNRQMGILEDHVSDVKSLQFGDYRRAEYLCQRTILLTSRFFPNSTFYLVELAQVSFTRFDLSGVHEQTRWSDAHNKLLAISQSLLDDVQLSAGPHGSIGWIRAVLVLLVAAVSSAILWSFNDWLKWTWLSAHPKKTALYLSFQMVIIFVVTLCFTKGKRAKIVEWSGIGFAIAFAILSLLN